jgi:hypothetical protein
MFYRTSDGFVAAGLAKVKCAGHFEEDKALAREEADVDAVKDKSSKDSKDPESVRETEIERQPASKAVPRKRPIIHPVDEVSAVDKLSSDMSELKELVVQLLKGSKSTAGGLSAASKIVPKPKVPDKAGASAALERSNARVFGLPSSEKAAVIATMSNPTVNTPSLMHDIAAAGDALATDEVNDPLSQYRSGGAGGDAGRRESRSHSPRRHSRSRSGSRSVSPDESRR